jgi:glycosyltransferase involved in cell wall biosynthesis
MTGVGLRAYRAGDDPAPGSVPVSVIVLTLNERANIRRCLASVAWADQIVVVDSGSSDGTAQIARSLGAEVVEQPWLGFSAQREYALRLPLLRHDWVYFVDADEWVSPQLAAEIATRLVAPDCAGFTHRLRLVFMGTWIRHCGWYPGSWVVRLVDRRYTRYDGTWVARACVEGRIRRLDNDIVDEDRKGLAAWLHKHIRYAELESERRRGNRSLAERLRALRRGDNTRPMVRGVLKELVFPSIPAKPVALFLYMYIGRLGFLDGVAGLRFCFYHAWFEMSVAALRAEARASIKGGEAAALDAAAVSS